MPKPKRLDAQNVMLKAFIDVTEAQSKICVKMLNDAINKRDPVLNMMALEALAKLEGMVIITDVYCNNPELVQHYYDGIEAGRKALNGKQ